MMATSSTMAINVTLYKQLPYDPGKDLALSALICSVPFVLVVNPDLPVNSVADLVKLAKERSLSYGSGGPGPFHHLTGRPLKTHFGRAEARRALPGRSAGAEGSGRRPHQVDVQRHGPGLSAGASRQGARARRDDPAPRRPGTGDPAARRGRDSGLRLGRLAIG